MGSTFHPVAEKDSRIESLQVGQIVQGNVISCSEVTKLCARQIYLWPHLIYVGLVGGRRLSKQMYTGS